jgi:hypothetical protein
LPKTSCDNAIQLQIIRTCCKNRTPLLNDFSMIEETLRQPAATDFVSCGHRRPADRRVNKLKKAFIPVPRNDPWRQRLTLSMRSLSEEPNRALVCSCAVFSVWAGSPGDPGCLKG